MGVFLSSPITDKESIDGICDRFVYGASSMQGWRITQEDAHNCIPVFDEKLKTSFFGVYDGHGGPEVAKFCERHFPSFVKNLMEAQGGPGDDPGLFIKNAFLAFDATLVNEDVVKELRRLAGKDKNETDHQAKSTETNKRKEKSQRQLDHLLAQYKNITQSKNVPKKEASKGSAIRFKSGLMSKTHNSGRYTENKPQSFLLSSLLLSNSHKQNSSSTLLEDDNQCRTDKTQNFMVEPNNVIEETVNNNNNNIEKSTNQITDEIITSDEAIELLLTSVNNGNKTSHESMEGNQGGEGDDRNTTSQVMSDNLIDPSSGEITLALNSLNEPKENSNKNDTASKVHVTDKIEQENEDSGASCDEEEDDDDMWEDMSDDDEEEEEEDENIVPCMMDTSNEEPGSDSGCTACVLLMQDNKLIVANAGDSRCVLSRAGKAIDLSFDHKPEDERERKRIEKAGGKVTLDGRVNGGLNLSRAIGDHVYKKNKDLPAKEQMITAFPDIEMMELCDEDQFIVIACDGIWNYMSSQEVVDYVLNKLKVAENRQKPSQICEKLFDHCLAPNTFGNGTGCDNMTCIIILLDKFIKSKCDQLGTTVAAETNDSLHASEDGSLKQRLPNFKQNDSATAGSFKRCSDSVEVTESKRLKVEEEVA